MAEDVICLDTSAVVKALVAEEPRAESEAAAAVLLRGLTDGRLVAPSWAWAEVGSVLRKKLRRGLLTAAETAALWQGFLELPIDFLDSAELRARAWQIAERHGLPTLYDAAFLACAEVAPAPPGARREYWTADVQLLSQVGPNRPSYVRRLGER